MSDRASPQGAPAALLEGLPSASHCYDASDASKFGGPIGFRQDLVARDNYTRHGHPSAYACAHRSDEAGRARSAVAINRPQGVNARA